ncbi:hypothetical protein AB9F34_34440, partial [Rhizobium leguminosarum]
EEDGAEALVFGCTGLMGCAFALREGLLAHGIDVPFIDPIPAAVSFAAALVRSLIRPQAAWEDEYSSSQATVFRAAAGRSA